MPEKHVHWADTVQEYSPPPRTPSPTWSDDSLPESASPFTPPPALPGNSLPSRIAAINAHPLVACSLHAPPLVWDVSHEPSTARLSSASRRRITSAELMQPATDPPLRYMEVQCGSLICWRPIQVIATSTDASVGVSLDDLLHGIRSYLQRPVTEVEFAQFATQPGMQQQISLAFHRRCERVDRAGTREQATNEKAQGLKRVDCLLGSDHIVGLMGPGKSPHIWQLYLAPKGQA